MFILVTIPLYATVTIHEKVIHRLAIMYLLLAFQENLINECDFVLVFIFIKNQTSSSGEWIIQCKLALHVAACFSVDLVPHIASVLLKVKSCRLFHVYLHFFGHFVSSYLLLQQLLLLPWLLLKIAIFFFSKFSTFEKLWNFRLFMIYKFN